MTAAAAPATDRFPMGEREFIAMMALLQALQALAIDVMLPSMGEIAHELGAANTNHRQYIIGMFLIGSGLGSLIPGPMADRFGRRPVLFTCLAAYCTLTLASALATSFAALLVLRFATGLFTSGLTVMPMAIIRDRFSGDRMARAQSLVSMVFMVVPITAPMMGQVVLLFAGWRWIFGIMALLAASLMAWALLRLPETLPPEGRHAIGASQIARNLAAILTTRASVGYILATAGTSAMFFNFLGTSQQLVAEHFGAGAMFPALFGAMAALMVLTNFANSRLVMRFGARPVSHFTLFAFIAVAALGVWLSFRPGQTLAEFLLPMGAVMCLTSFMTANFTATALQPFARIAGAAASAQAFVRMSLGALGGSLLGLAFDGTARPVALSALGAGCMALALVTFSERGRLFRRVPPPEAE